MGLMTIKLADCSPGNAPHLAKAQAIAAAQADVIHATRRLSACTLADELATRFDVASDAIWQAFAGVPSNLQSLLDTPQGWTALGEYVATTLGLDAPAYLPQVH